MRSYYLFFVFVVLVSFIFVKRYSSYPIQSETSVSPSTQVIKLKKTEEWLLLESIIKSLNYSHLVFSEVWRLLMGDAEQAPPSVMKFVAQKLSLHLDHQTKFDTPSPMSKRPCASDYVDLFMQKNKKNGSVVLRLDLVKCKSQQKETVAEIFFESQKKYMLRVQSALASDAVGYSLATLNLKVFCEMYLQEDKLAKFKCENLGQGMGKTRHFLFKKFEYKMDAKNLLSIAGDEYSNLVEKNICTDEKPCFQLVAPMQGKIKITENRIFKKPQLQKLQTENIISTLQKAEGENQNETQTNDEKKQQAQDQNSEKSEKPESPKEQVVEQKFKFNQDGEVIDPKPTRPTSGQTNDEFDPNSNAAKGIPDAQPDGQVPDPVLLPEGQHPGMHH